MYDTIIRNGSIIDGTGKQRFESDLAIKNGKIAAIGNLKRTPSKTVIDAKGCIVCPGFIDNHCHGDLNVLADPLAQNQLLQGITTEVAGNCGISFAPIRGECDRMVSAQTPFLSSAEREEYYRDITFPEFMDKLEEMDLGVNLVNYIGQGIIRQNVMKYQPGKANPHQMEEMKRILQEALDAGAAGMSSGLIYPTGSLTDTEEMIELCKVVAERGKNYSTHMRNEGDSVDAALKEAIHVADESGVRLIVSHHKVSGIKNHGRSVETIGIINEAIKRGSKIFMDQYPYAEGGTMLVMGCIPKEDAADRELLIKKLENSAYRAQLAEKISNYSGERELLLISSGGPEYTMVARAPGCRNVEGKTLLKISEELGKDPYDVMFDIIQQTDSQAMGIFTLASEDDIERIMKHPHTMFGTDASHATYCNVFSHPRATSSFPHIIKKYVNERNVISLEEMVRKSTSLPADVVGISNKGRLAVGMDADLVIFNNRLIQDYSTYMNPNKGNSGIKYVFISGQIVVQDDKVTGIKAGKLIRIPNRK